MIINNLHKLLDQNNITAYALAKKGGVSPGNIKAIAKDETVIPREKALEAICTVLSVNIDSVLKYDPTRINARSNKALNRSRLTQNYTSNEQYNALDVQRQLREQQEEMMIIY